MLHRFSSITLATVLILGLTAVLALAGTAVAEAPAELGPGRLVLVPVNLGIRANDAVEPGLEPVWREMLAHFGNGERPVTALERKSALSLWRRLVARMERNGKRDVYEAYAQFAREISGQLDYDTIVFPSVVLRKARLTGTSAYWDGVRRHVDAPLVGHEALTKLTGPDLVVSREGLTGEIAAASLHVAVLDASGELRFEGAGGLTLVQDLVQGEKWGDAKLGVAMREDAFSDAEELREGIETAFRESLPASRAH